MAQPFYGYNPTPPQPAYPQYAQPQYVQPQYAQPPQYGYQYPPQAYVTPQNQQVFIPPHLITQQPQQPQPAAPAQPAAQASLIPRGQVQPWTPPPTAGQPAAPAAPPAPGPAPAAGISPSQVQADQLAQRQSQVQAIIDQQATGSPPLPAPATPLVPVPQAPVQAPAQAPAQAPPVQHGPPQMVVTNTMLSIGREINGLLRLVQRCEIASHSQQAVELPDLGIVQPPQLASTVQKLLTQAAQLLRTLDEVVQRGNAATPIDWQERLVRHLVESPDHLPQQV